MAVQARMRVCCCGVPFFSLYSGLRERKNLSQLDSGEKKTLDGPSPRADDEHHAVLTYKIARYYIDVWLNVMRTFFRSHRLYVLSGVFPTTSLPASSTLFYIMAIVLTLVNASEWMSKGGSDLRLYFLISISATLLLGCLLIQRLTHNFYCENVH